MTEAFEDQLEREAPKRATELGLTPEEASDAVTWLYSVLPPLANLASPAQIRLLAWCLEKASERIEEEGE